MRKWSRLGSGSSCGSAAALPRACTFTRTSTGARWGLLCGLPCLPPFPQPSRAEDAGLRQIDFKLARPGLMKNFEGKWRVQPFTQATLGEVSGQHMAQSRPRWLPAAFDNLHFRAPFRVVGCYFQVVVC